MVQCQVGRRDRGRWAGGAGWQGAGWQGAEGPGSGGKAGQGAGKAPVNITASAVSIAVWHIHAVRRLVHRVVGKHRTAPRPNPATCWLHAAFCCVRRPADRWPLAVAGQRAGAPQRPQAQARADAGAGGQLAGSGALGPGAGAAPGARQRRPPHVGHAGGAAAGRRPAGQGAQRTPSCCRKQRTHGVHMHACIPANGKTCRAPLVCTSMRMFTCLARFC